MNPKISLLISVYNLDKYISTMLDSLLAQTDNIFNVILCNDGSTDNTEVLVNSYIPKFEKKNIGYQIITKENGGLASTINAMLPFVKTDYFITCDGDDWYENNLIEILNNYIDKNGDFDLGIIPAKLYNEDKTFLEHRYFNQEDLSTDLYLRYLKADNIPCFPGVNIINIESFKKYNKKLAIYDSRHGQDWQLLLPLLKNIKPVFIYQTAYCYLIRQNSMSHCKASFENVYKRINGYMDILDHVLFELGDNKNRKERIAFYNYKICEICYSYKKRKVFLRHFFPAKKTFKLFVKALIMLLMFWVK